MDFSKFNNNQGIKKVRVGVTSQAWQSADLVLLEPDDMKISYPVLRGVPWKRGTITLQTYS